MNFNTCAALPVVSGERRRAITAGLADRAAHRRLVADIEALHRIELALPPKPAEAIDGQARVLFWNAERGRHLDQSAALLAGQGAEINLVCELDHGMARSFQRHTARELAGRLGQGYAFAVEFLELGLGDVRERARHAGEENALGFHGGAILSAHVLERPVLIRLEGDGAWFDGDRGERRVGGRIAQAATLTIAGTKVVFAVVHFESHSDPDHRARQMETLLHAIDAYAPGAPAIIGGDFNTASAPRDALKAPGGLQALLAQDSQRLIDPVRHEKLFAVAGAAGYDWSGCNDGKPTQRLRSDQAPKPLGRIDWFFTRGLEATAPETVPAVDGDGRAISDHDALAVNVRSLAV